jgi:hypothetical protein
MESESTYLLVALPAEAKPLIRAFNLKRRQPDGPFPHYVNNGLSLVLTGPGKRRASEAINHLLTLKPGEFNHWINLGIMGHATEKRGTCLLIDQVIDASSGSTWDLNPLPDLSDTRSSPLLCVEKAEVTYAKPVGFDMESAAIAAALSEHNALPRLHMIKVVSDNPNHPSHEISGRMVSELMSGHLPTIASLINRLQTHAETQ